MKIKCLLFICVVTFGCSRESSNHKHHNRLEIPYVNIKERKLFQVFDDRIAIEKTCPYYSDTNYFSISITKFPVNTFSISFESGNDLSLILSLEPKGFFVYKKHLFFLLHMDTDLFSFSNKKCVFIFKDFLDFNIDDSWTVVSYSLNNGEFKKEHIRSSCVD